MAVGEATGEAVAGWQPGSHVVGVGYGAFAEYMVLPAVATMPLPEGWTAEQALGLVVNWPTALAALKSLGHIASGETVVVHAVDMSWRPLRSDTPTAALTPCASGTGAATPRRSSPNSPSSTQ